MYINLITIDLCPGQGGGGVKPSGTLEISENGVYNVYSYSSASVDVHPSTSLSETYISNGNYNITGEFNGGVITVDVPAPQFVTETLNVSANGTYNPGEGVDGYSQVVVDVPQSVTGYTEKDLTENLHQTITSLNNSASFVGEDAFEDAHNLQTVNLPQCEIIYKSAFAHCYNLTSINLPICNTIEESVFNNCSSLQTINLPQCKNIQGYAFFYCKLLSQIDLSECNVISGYNTFGYCSSLQSVNLPNCYMIGISTFNNCENLTYLNIPKLFCNTSNNENINIPVYNLYSINFPLLPRCYNNFFFLGWNSKCLNLSKINLPIYYSRFSALYFFNGSFPALNEISIGNKTYIVPSLYNVKSSFINDFTNNNGIINVDAAMYDKWVSNSQWSSLSSFFSVTGDPTIPMLSIDENNTLYGKTELLENDWSTYVTNPSTITSIYLPSCKVVYDGLNQTYLSLSSLSHINLPECIAFMGSISTNYYNHIETLNLPKCEVLINFNFGEQSNMTMTLGNSSVCTCLSIDGSIADGIGMISFIKSILVPASLLDAYKSTIPWMYYSSKIFPI